VLIGAVPPLMLKTDTNPSGVFDGFREGTAFDRAQFAETSRPDRSAASTAQGGGVRGRRREPVVAGDDGVVENRWWRAMMGGVEARYEGIEAFSETDFTDDLRAIEVPTLVMHGDDDQVMPIAASAELSIEPLQDGTLKVYPGYPHGMCTTAPTAVDPDPLAFIQA
jgi:non-heme chloroperoxidase